MSRFSEFSELLLYTLYLLFFCREESSIDRNALLRVTTHFSELRRTSPSYAALLRVTTHFSELRRTSPSYNALLRVTPHFSVLRRTSPSYNALLRVTTHFSELRRYTLYLLFFCREESSTDRNAAAHRRRIVDESLYTSAVYNNLKYIERFEYRKSYNFLLNDVVTYQQPV
jgi:hypothetical protein